MVWQYSPYFIPFLACGFITLILAVTGWRNRSYICAKPFALLMLAASLWSFCTALELASADLATQMLAISIEYAGMVIIPVAWLLFSLEYTGREYWITRKNVTLLCVIPVFTVIMVATNSYHYLYYSSVSEILYNGLSFHTVTYGPLFWLHSVYSYLLIGAAIILLLHRFVLTNVLYRAQMMILLIATLIPLFVNLAFVLRLGSTGFIDPTPFAFVISGFAILIGMLRYQLLDITPMAQDQVIANMNDGMIVLDVQNRIISLNGPAEKFIGIPMKDAVGIPAGSFLPCIAQPLPVPPSADLRHEEVHAMERTTGGTGQFFELRCNPILSRENEVKGRIVIIRDITSQKMVENALALARKKINLLSSITRHDILNQVTVLLLNIDTFREMAKDPETLELIRVQENAIENIRHQIEFARDYEALGGKAPQWMDIREIFQNLLPIMGTYALTFIPPEKHIEIFADPLLERVFYNLVDNSIQHGGHVTTISIRCEKIADGIMILYEDNGEGVPGEIKPKIFDRGFGKHSGLGLFLAREILGITGLSIRETGVPGIGVRFEIRVPEGQYRIRP